jgi:hypothetical protein
MNEILALWFAYVVTRPIAASFADYFSKPKDISGLGLGDLETAGVITLLVAILVVYTSLARFDIQSPDSDPDPDSDPAAGAGVGAEVAGSTERGTTAVPSPETAGGDRRSGPARAVVSMRSIRCGPWISPRCCWSSMAG